ncbi:unnamed protein product (plasmid) [Mycetohabitans rhizoxinica HKI 454]|uniref:Uncharacterized protein n=1 Tax=Mycetohabitans rhizoxinica (strain DSM 19002 / CIP 109453 / HKI 454) TaxID=882378 RepID=E5AVG0_MYCRK|nr:unnamed protein product [Mycetohabitans rhizoxinica HKI 454]
MRLSKPTDRDWRDERSNPFAHVGKTLPANPNSVLIPDFCAATNYSVVTIFTDMFLGR